MNQGSEKFGDTAENNAHVAAVYEYSFDLEGDGSAPRVARLVGDNKTVLEVGCGPGSQSRVFKEKLGCEVVGIEIDPERAKKASAYCKHVHVANLETDDIAQLLGVEKFDVIVCADVLEHLRNPRHLLSQLSAFLKPSGYLIASIPNATHASIVYEMVHGRFEYQAEGLLDSTHVRLFSCGSALALVEGAGYWIAELQKVHKLPQRTNIMSAPVSVEDKQLLAAIQSRNPDATTYQFVIKAYPLNNSTAGEVGAHTMREEIRQLRGKVASYKTEIDRLNSALGWYRTPLLTRLLKKFGHRRSSK